MHYVEEPSRIALPNPFGMSAKPRNPRKLTVGQTVQPCPNNPSAIVPMIRLRGLWLAQAGFLAGDRMEVFVGDGEIRIRPLSSRDS